ncbi:Uncharacterised protein [Klebsiella pneumoniae]|nr:Uncharacterised protein [Klebsiella pneumoniae]
MIFGRICARQLLTVLPMNVKPFTEILAKMFRLFPFSQLRHHGPVHPFLPGNGSGGFIDRDLILIFF